MTHMSRTTTYNKFSFSNNHLISTRWADRLDTSAIPFSIHSTFNATPLAFHFQLSDLTSSPLPVFWTNSPRTDSDDSTQTDLNKISNFNNSDVKTSDEFLHSELSPSTFWKPPFQQLTSQLPNESSPAPSSYTDATHNLSPMSSDQPDPPSPKKHN